MTILLSASAIKDFLECSKKYQYRRFEKSKAKPTKALTIGSVVHEVVEKSWDNFESALEQVQILGMEAGLEDSEIQYAQGLLNTFFDNFTWMLSHEDTVEQDFRIPLYKGGVDLVGKLDRVTHSNLLIDWKTSKKPPTALEMAQDPQFILYDWAFEQLYGTRPSSFYMASLSSGNLTRYNRNKDYESYLLSEVVPNIIQRIYSGDFYAEGIYKYNKPCWGCVFKETCYNELDS